MTLHDRFPKMSDLGLRIMALKIERAEVSAKHTAGKGFGAFRFWNLTELINDLVCGLLKKV
jgi:hypothetical protein